MAKIEWNESYSVNNEEIDAQHKKLFSIVNTLHDALMNKDSNDITLARDAALKSLEEYSQEHFSFEERYLQSIGYPEFEQHKKEHGKFIQRVAKLRNELSISGVLVPTEVMNIVVEWLSSHTLREDQKYRRFAEQQS